MCATSSARCACRDCVAPTRVASPPRCCPHVTPSLRSDTGVYYCRQRVPAHLRAAFGVTVIKRSLQTKDFREAKRLHATEERAFAGGCFCGQNVSKRSFRGITVAAHMLAVASACRCRENPEVAVSVERAVAGGRGPLFALSWIARSRVDIEGRRRAATPTGSPNAQHPRRMASRWRQSSRRIARQVPSIGYAFEAHAANLSGATKPRAALTAGCGSALCRPTR